MTDEGMLETGQDGFSGDRPGPALANGRSQSVATGLPRAERARRLAEVQLEIDDLRTVIKHAKLRRSAGVGAELRSKTEVLIREVETVRAELSSSKDEQFKSRAAELLDIVREAREILRALDVTSPRKKKNGLAGSYGYQYRA